jgi:hypothetical protein
MPVIPVMWEEDGKIIAQDQPEKLLERPSFKKTSWA